MERRIRIYRVTGIVLVVFLAFMHLPAYGASKPETGYYILTGSFKNLTNAEQEWKRLKKYNASITEESLSGNKWYRVSIGPYKNKDKAKSMARQLKRKKVIASYNIKIMAKATPGLEIVSVTKSTPQKEQVISEAAPTKAAPVTVVPYVPEAVVQSPGPETSPAPPAKWAEDITLPPVTDQTTISARMPEAPAKADIATSQLLPEKPAADLEKIQPEKKPEKAVEHPPAAAEAPKAKKEKDWFITAGYNLWYIDMSKKYVGADFASKGFIHGPTIGFSKGKFGISLTYLSTMGNTLSADVNDTFDSGEAYSRHESLKREDYDATLRYTFFDVKRLSLSGLAGLKYTKLSDMSNMYTRAGGQYTITGNLDIWGPFLGMEIIAPLGEPSRTPLFLSLSASGMFLKGTGNHPQFVPASGGSYGTTFEGADFSAAGWGAYEDAHFIWKVTNEFQFQLGERYQSASLKDTSPQGYTMRASNGYFAVYTRLSYDW